MEQHVRGTEDAGAVTVRREIAEKTVEASDGPERSDGLLTCQSTGGREDAGIHAPTVIEHVPYCHCHLELLALSLGGGGFGIDGRGLGGDGAKAGRRVYGRRRASFDAVGSQTGEKRVHVAGIRQGQGAETAVVLNLKT